ncbi:hypothetical protein HIM_09731 [Hirsutella minnesotensis 3608]|uniref:Uncharacterized protein n=1 Tax=Hirsutella minnesotensis 3608 TaxID=1043627 RepID=A0A0F7ZGG8_9HYPO|nr:hypothetical protein HIM_09731 [Hirsutella minnesotensis 3608]
MVWVEKVTYGSTVLAETYCLAASKATPLTFHLGDSVSRFRKVSTCRVDHFVNFFARLPLFSKEPSWRLRASIVEGLMFVPELERAALNHGLPYRQQGTYLEYIPLTWTTCNNAANFGLPTDIVVKMMVISMLNFQIDKWFEDITGDERLNKDFGALRGVIRQLFDDGAEPMVEYPRPYRDRLLRNPPIPTSDGSRKADLLHEGDSTLSRFVEYVLSHLSFALPCSLRRRVMHELSIFLQAHVTQGEDSSLIALQDRRPVSCQVFAGVRSTYYDWVRATSADHTSCPYSFELFRCLVSDSICGGIDCFSGARTQYLAQDVCRHLATICRQHNDYGSVARDQEQNNLNSVNFPEFHGEDSKPEDEKQAGDKAKKTLLAMANYEQECLELAVKKLRQEIQAPAWKAWEVFINVTIIYGQIYLLQDINADSRKPIEAG